MATDFPESKRLIDEQILAAELTPEETRKIFCDTCLDYFRIERTGAETTVA
jgi:hypothetical protein